MREELIGQQFGKWTVIGVPQRYGYITVRCECGTVRDTQAAAVRSGRSASCGCKQRTDGISHGACVGGLTPVYRAWSNMLSRCRNPHHQAYDNYGGRGIKVCKRWESFANFYVDMGERPEGCSLERRKNWLGYSPKNCYWATRIEQESNKRTTRMLTAFGETKTMAAWERDARCEVAASTLRWRIRGGWQMPDALYR
jgi:hypothetical protein